jgi:two-component system chemotaxis response regulator CheY
MQRQTILVVDDSTVMRQLTLATLEEAGFRVLLAQDGKTALEQAGAAVVDLVLTDWTMAPMDGGELTRQLRQLPGYAGVPILILSTVSHQRIKEEARQSGASGWLGKPVDPATLLAVIGSLLNPA